MLTYKDYSLILLTHQHLWSISHNHYLININLIYFLTMIINIFYKIYRYQ